MPHIKILYCLSALETCAHFKSRGTFRDTNILMTVRSQTIRKEAFQFKPDIHYKHAFVMMKHKEKCGKGEVEGSLSAHVGSVGWIKGTM